MTFTCMSLISMDLVMASHSYLHDVCTRVKLNVGFTDGRRIMTEHRREGAFSKYPRLQVWTWP